MALDTKLTPDLEREGLARELVHRLQGVRRDAGLTLTDWVTITVDTGDEALAAVIAQHGEHIASETIARRVAVGTLPDDAQVVELAFGRHTARIGIQRSEG